MIHEILLSVIADTEQEATDATEQVAEQHDMDVTEVVLQLLNTDPGDADADLIDAVLMQSRLGPRVRED